MVFILYDTFNQKIISRHRTIEAAGKANRSLQKAVKKHNGESSYIPVDLRRETKNGMESVNIDDFPDSEQESWFMG